MKLIENQTYDALQVGDHAQMQRTLTQSDIELFAFVSGDINPAHLDPEYARDDMFHHIVGHGMWGASLISAVLGTRLPGPGTIYLEQTLRFLKPVIPGDTVTAMVTVKEKIEKGHRLILDCVVTNQNHDVVIEGTAKVIAPTEKVSRAPMSLPEVSLQR